MQIMEIRDVIKMIDNQLSPFYAKEEIRSFTDLMFEHILGMSVIKRHLSQHELISDAKLSEIKEITERLKKYEPVQYILGQTTFYGLKFKVSPAVLIPRPETEELVDWILKDSPKENSKVVDIGTGSGCIAVALAKNRPDLHTEGWDISEDSLKVARQNAEINKVKVEFRNVDILSDKDHSTNQIFDFIVSNPPYVTPADKSLMLKNVTDHEPHLALFVPDNDPLIFYKAIAGFAVRNLKKNGVLYFEINENMGNKVMNLLKSYRFSELSLKKDINGKNRMVRCTL